MDSTGCAGSWYIFVGCMFVRLFHKKDLWQQANHSEASKILFREVFLSYFTLSLEVFRSALKSIYITLSQFYPIS